MVLSEYESDLDGDKDTSNRTELLESCRFKVNGEYRFVSVFRSPDVSAGSPIVCLCTDGQVIPGFLPLLNQARSRREIPTFVMVGVHSSPDARASEYLFDPDSSVFREHDQLFVEIVPRWLREELRIDIARERTALFGFSNGGAYVLSVGARFPELAGAVVAFSATRSIYDSVLPKKEAFVVPRYYLAAGTIGPEKMCRKNTLNILKRLQTRGIECNYRDRPFGHEMAFWQSELPLALNWAFGR